MRSTGGTTRQFVVVVLVVFVVVVVGHLGFMAAIGSASPCHVAAGAAACVVSDALASSLLTVLVSTAVVFCVFLASGIDVDVLRHRAAILIRATRCRSLALLAPDHRSLTRGITQRAEGVDARA